MLTHPFGCAAQAWQNPASSDNDGIMDTLIERFKSLPQRPDETWQGGLVPMSGWVSGEEGTPYRPIMPLWVAVRAGKVHCGDLLRPDEANLAAAVEALLNYACENEFGGYCPGRIEVADGSLAERLSGLLIDTSIEVRLLERLDAVEQVLEEMDIALNRGGPPVPGPLDADGVTLELLREFAAAAGAFYRVAPWRFLTDIDLIRVEAPPMPSGMEHCTVLGAGGSLFGLAFYPSAEALFDFHRAGSLGDRDQLHKLSLWQLSFNAVFDFPPKDEDIWRKYDLPVAGDSAFPLFVRFSGNRSVTRAGERELRAVIVVLQALAETNESDIDAGRWRKTVATAPGTAEVTVSIPDLLKPPTIHEWIKRGVQPDRRAHERLNADMERFFRSHPVDDIDQMNAVLTSRFSGRKIDALVTQPETPLERAQEVCFQAFDTYGRRRVQLARQALEICADCADAYVILAEQSGTREDALDRYSQGVAAGARALGAEAFVRDVGHFWGIASTRPYMRAVFGLAETLGRLGRDAEAVDQYQELLRLNPDDNQGARYLLMPRLLCLGRDEAAARLLKGYDESSANWTYARALLAYRLSGPSVAARRALRAAFQANPHLPRFLHSDDALPLPDHYSPGSVEEAILAAEELSASLRATPGAIDWILAEAQQWEMERNARQREKGRQVRKKEKKRKRR
jgi:tetratricopeptide (TPR) repeat protein